MSDNDEFRDRLPDEAARRDRPREDDDHAGDDLDREHADDPGLPTTNQPLNAAPRPRWSPVLGVVALVVVIAVVFIVITWLRYNT